jgi:hypothetical protein
MIESYNTVKYAMENIDGNYQLGYMNISKEAINFLFTEYTFKKIDECMFKLNGEDITNPCNFINIAAESHFGDLEKCTTVVDKTVRDSLEITSGLEFTEEGLVEIKRFCSLISKTLYGKKVYAEIDKMVIYPPGGFFKQHQDTPKNGSVGTIICIFPGSYTGGELTVGEKGWFAADASNYTLVSFYGNTVHSVRKVYDGFRASVTLSVHELGDEEYDSDYDCSEDEEDEDYDMECLIEREEVEISIDRVFEKIMVMLEEKNIGIILFNEYSNAEICARSFRGNDVLLMQKIREKMIDYVVTPVLVHYHNENCREYSNGNGGFCKIYTFSKKDIDSINKCKFEEPEIVKEYKGTEFVGFCKQTLKSDYQKYIEYTGNECQPETIDNYYYEVAIICNKLNQ